MSFPVPGGKAPSAVLVIAVLVLSGLRAGAQNADDVVRSVESHYRELSTLTATVKQKNILKSVNRTQTFEGTLFIKKPGKLRLEYTNGQLIVVDGNEAWFYSRKSEQAIRRAFRDFEQANIPVAFLLGAGDIRSEFDVFPTDAGSPRSLGLAPKKSGAAMKRLRMDVDEAGRILTMTIYDASGNVSEIAFTGIQEAVTLDDRLFRFKAPKGTEIIEQ